LAVLRYFSGFASHQTRQRRFSKFFRRSGLPSALFPPPPRRIRACPLPGRQRGRACRWADRAILDPTPFSGGGAKFPPPIPVEPSRVKRRFGRRSPTNVSGGSTHSPDFAAHVHEIESASR
jgi:hypothetical protein